MKNKKGYGLLFGIALAVIILDQITKALVMQNIPSGGSWMPLDWLVPYARIVNWYNSGVALGLFQGGGILFAVLAFIVACGLVYYYPRIPHEEVLMRVAFGLMLGGAMGNLIDRVHYGGTVVDFISVGTFPVFNVADSAVTIGVCLMLLASLLDSRKTKKQQETPGDPPSPANEE